jgi:hypothetical protein
MYDKTMITHKTRLVVMGPILSKNSTLKIHRIFFVLSCDCLVLSCLAFQLCPRQDKTRRDQTFTIFPEGRDKSPKQTQDKTKQYQNKKTGQDKKTQTQTQKQRQHTDKHKEKHSRNHNHNHEHNHSTRTTITTSTTASTTKTQKQKQESLG